MGSRCRHRRASFVVLRCSVCCSHLLAGCGADGNWFDPSFDLPIVALTCRAGLCGAADSRELIGRVAASVHTHGFSMGLPLHRDTAPCVASHWFRGGYLAPRASIMTVIGGRIDPGFRVGAIWSRSAERDYTLVLGMVILYSVFSSDGVVGRSSLRVVIARQVRTVTDNCGAWPKTLLANPGPNLIASWWRWLRYGDWTWLNPSGGNARLVVHRADRDRSCHWFARPSRRSVCAHARGARVS